MEEDNTQGLPLESQAVASFLHAYQMESAPSSCLPRERSNQVICDGSTEEKKEKGREGVLTACVGGWGTKYPKTSSHFISSFIGRLLVTSPDIRSSSFLIVSRISTTLGLFVDI